MGYFDFDKGINDVDEVTLNSNDKAEDKTTYELYVLYFILFEQPIITVIFKE